MSEEILQALLRLFAILIRQAKSVSGEQLEFVRNYLLNVLSGSDVNKYYKSFEEYLALNKDNFGTNQTAPLDSVDVIRICYKINETLNPEQKSIVLLRCFQLIHESDGYKAQEGILKTCAEIFHISKTDYANISLLVDGKSEDDFNMEGFFNLPVNYSYEFKEIRSLKKKDLSGATLLKLEGTNLFFIKNYGSDKIELNGNLLAQGEIEMLPRGAIVKTPSSEHWHYTSIADVFRTNIKSEEFVFEAREVRYEFSSGTLGLEKTSFRVGESNIVAIMGASGSGKTTLLRILSGIDRPTWGSVSLNNMEIHEAEAHKNIGYVSQDDLLIEELTVFQNLYLSAKLIFGDITKDQLIAKVDETLDQLDLEETRDLKVGSVENKVLSGGQRKRLNIGLELIRNPRVLFLDEPLSGLSSRDSTNVMSLLSQLKLEGHLLFIVVHQPSSEIYKQFDKILIVDKGGCRIYYGNPIEALSYFREKGKKINKEITHCAFCGNVNPEEIFEIIEEKVLDEYGRETVKRRISPREWYLQFEHHRKENTLEKKQINTVLTSNQGTRPSGLSQMFTFLRRDWLTKLSNFQYLALLISEPIILALILAYLVRHSDGNSGEGYSFYFNDNIPAYFFISIVVVIFMSLTMSAEEIFRDRKILIRERFLELSRMAYLSSKFILMSLISAIQVIIFVLIGNGILDFREGYMSSFVMLFSLAVNSNMLGLIISQTFKTAVSIYISIPLLIIPQLILGGAMFSYEKLNLDDSEKGYPPVVANLIPARWAYEGMMVNQFMNNKYESRLYSIDQKISHFSYKNGSYISELYRIIDDGMNEIKKEVFSSGHKERMQILFNELEKESNMLPDLEISLSSSIPFSKERGNQLKDVLRALSEFYVGKYNSATALRDKIISNTDDLYQLDLTKIKFEYHNKKVENLVKKSFAEPSISIENGELVRSFEPIFINQKKTNNIPDRYIFFSPSKFLFTFKVNTFWYNISMLWIFSLVLFAFLYFNGFKTLLIMLKRIF